MRLVTRHPVRVGSGRLAPALAETYPWRCAEHVAKDTEACRDCCGSCYFLDPGAGCALGSFKPIRCKTYPLIPRRDRVIIDERCPEAGHFLESLKEKDPRALALLEMAKAMSDLQYKKADDQSMEVRWLMKYVRAGFKGPVLWKRGRLLATREPTRAPPARGAGRRKA